jgi:membrane protease YdiL (CAAX protease family)
MDAEGTGIIEGPSPDVPHAGGLGRWLVEEIAWLLAAFAATILTASILQGRGGALAAAAPGVALFGFHGLVGAHVVRADRLDLSGWFRVDRGAVLWGLCGGAVLLAFNGAYGFVLEKIGIVPPDVAALLRGLMPRSLLFVWAALLAPAVEEMYFRGRLIGAFSPRLGPGWAGAISSLAFAAIHGIPAFFPAYVLFAFSLLWLRRRTGGLVAPILAHMINNAFALLGS